MKRLILHIGFWSLYLLLCMNMEWLWVSRAFPDMQLSYAWKHVVLSNFLTSYAELIFAYYLMYIGYKRVADKNIPLFRSLSEIFVALIITLIIIRLSSFYSLKYLVYDRRLAETELWDIANMWRLMIYVGFSCGMALSIKLSRQQVKVARRQQELAQEKSNIELQLLRSQLHPHFLFNTLNNIYALSRKKSDDAPETIMKLSELLDFMLYRSNTDTIPLAQEIKFLEDYISLETIRYSNKLTIDFLKDTGNENAMVAPFLLLPLVENAFKHGTGETRKDSFIHIEIVEKNNVLQFSIHNNFEKRTGINNKEKLGLQNVKRRLELLYKDHSIETKENADSFSVQLHINLNSYAKA